MMVYVVTESCYDKTHTRASSKSIIKCQSSFQRPFYLVKFCSGKIHSSTFWSPELLIVSDPAVFIFNYKIIGGPPYDVDYLPRKLF